METTNTTVLSEPKECDVCGVPSRLHGTCCGWSNADIIIYPRTDEEADWQRRSLAATGFKITINDKGAVLSIDHGNKN